LLFWVVRAIFAVELNYKTGGEKLNGTGTGTK